MSRKLHVDDTLLLIARRLRSEYNGLSASLLVRKMKVSRSMAERIIDELYTSEHLNHPPPPRTDEMEKHERSQTEFNATRHTAINAR